MKTNTSQFQSFIVIFIIFCCISCSQAQDAEKLSSDKLETATIKTTASFITEFYEALSSGSTYDFNSENATDVMVSTFTPEVQRNAYQQIKNQLGEYKEAEYIEAWEISSTPDHKILRFKGDFTGSTSKVEVRVVLNDANKIAGFYVKPWSDMMM